MPLYEYECSECSRRTEVIQRFDEAPLAVCPHCGGEVRRLLSAPSFQFKGSGWYVTDYARKSGGDGKEKAGGDGKEKAGGDGAGSLEKAAAGKAAVGGTAEKGDKAAAGPRKDKSAAAKPAE